MVERHADRKQDVVDYCLAKSQEIATETGLPLDPGALVVAPAGAPAGTRSSYRPGEPGAGGIRFPLASDLNELRRS